MDVLQTYIFAFINAIGSKKQLREATREILEKMISYEQHTLTTSQQAQARENIGINLVHKVGQEVYLTKGTHNISFGTAFEADYIVIPYGTTGTVSFVPIITDKTHLDYFTVKMPTDGYLSWVADLVTEPVP